MSKILILSLYGDGADLAIDAKRDGHEARLWIQDPKRRHVIYKDLVPQVDDWKESLDWCDLVIFDANKMSEEWKIASKVKPCWGGSPAGEKMEQDRDFAHGLMEKAGMKALTSDTFKTLEEAIKFVSKKKGLRVCKIVGGDADSEDIIISEMEGAEDAIALMQRYIDSGKKYDLVEVEERIIGVEDRRFQHALMIGGVLAIFHDDNVAFAADGDRLAHVARPMSASATNERTMALNEVFAAAARASMTR